MAKAVEVGVVSKEISLVRVVKENKKVPKVDYPSHLVVCNDFI